MSHTRILFWASRITGTLWLLFLVFMVVGHLTGDANGTNGMVFNDAREVLAFLFFPIGTIVGLSLAYKKALLGGSLALLSLVALVLLRPDLLQATFFVMAVPGVLYCLYAWASTTEGPKGM